jgi:FkbM family methyltransferase
MQPVHEVSRLQWVENSLLRILARAVATPVMIDVGAHHGTSLFPFFHNNWQCYAFEPIEENRKQLLANAGDSTRLVVRPEVVSDASGEKEFHLALNLDGTLHEYNHSLERINEDAWHRKGPTVRVPAVTLDDLISRGELPDRVGVLKIDTEGHDLAVLRGASRLHADIISVEFWENGHAFGPSPSPAPDMIRLLQARGYQQYLVLWHYLDNTRVQLSTLADLPSDAWGNLFFFHTTQNDLFARLCADPDWTAVVAVAGEFEALSNEMRSKEATIEDLAHAAAERLRCLLEMNDLYQELRKDQDDLQHTLADVRNTLSDVRSEFEAFKQSPPLRDALRAFTQRVIQRLTHFPFLRKTG